MSLADFASASLVVEVRSKILGEVVVLASDHAQVDPGERRAVYRARELSILSDLTEPAELQTVHAVKKTFRGTITDVAPAGRGRNAR